MFENFQKVMTSQEIKVKCIKEDEHFRVGKEYEAYYNPPSIIGSHLSEFCVRNKIGVHYGWEEFYEHFEVLTEGFEGVPYIEFEFK